MEEVFYDRGDIEARENNAAVGKYGDLFNHLAVTLHPVPPYPTLPPHPGCQMVSLLVAP